MLPLEGGGGGGCPATAERKLPPSGHALPVRLTSSMFWGGKRDGRRMRKQWR